MGGDAYLDNIPPLDEMPDNVFAITGKDWEPVHVPPGVDDEELPGVADPKDWMGHNAPARRFIIPGWLVRGHAGLLSGMEGVGKSLIAQQMLTCAAIGRPFLGLEIEKVRAVYITCEDSQDELWRRQESINAALGITMEDLAGKLLLVSLCGELGNELGTFSADGVLTPSKRYRQIAKRILDFGAELVVLDNAAHMFAGNENARHDVAAFLGLIERLSQQMDGAVLLLAHPNKQHAQGNKQGNEYSGSTGWSAHVRNRLFLDYVSETEEGLPVDDDERVLRKSKANYGKRGEEIYFRWHDWAFVKPEEMGAGVSAEISRIAVDSEINERFLACLRVRTKQRRAVSEKVSSAYAPKVFASMAEARGTSKKMLEGAMERLFRIGKIERAEVWKGADRKPVYGLRETEIDPEKVRDTQNGYAAKPLKSFAGDRAGDRAGHVRETAGDYMRETAGDTHHSTTYISGLGAPNDMYVPAGEERFEDVPPIEPPADQPDFGDFRDNPLFRDRP